MKIPLSWLEEFVAFPKEIDAKVIEAALVRVGFEVESIESQGQDLSGPLLIGKVVEIEELSGHKKPIRFVSLDCGEPEKRQVICGATNFASGDHVVVALPGAILPGNFKIAARETYGKTSNGMICSAKELGLGDDHSGIINLGKNSDLKLGSDAIAGLLILDTVFDVSINPDRGYAMSIRGIGREIANALELKYQDPVNRISIEKYPENKKGVGVKIEDAGACSFISIRSVGGFDSTARVPIWMRRRIEKCGMRSISLAVDITNYVMLELGQPLHAFDADKLSGDLRVRLAGKDKELKTLDGVVRKLNESDLIISDEKQPLALAGTMGGEHSEVTEKSSRLAIEAARFNPQYVARNSRQHILSSEASRRLERGVDAAIAQYASARALDLLIELGNATYVGSSQSGTVRMPVGVEIDSKKISNLLGMEISVKEIVRLIEKIGCLVEIKGEHLKVTPPSWRFDLSHYSDFAEEVARQLGYEQIPSTLPTGKKGAALSSFQRRKRFTASYLAHLGFNETYNSPFINQTYLESLGFSGDRAKTFKLLNPMSEEFPSLRTHLLPGLFLTAQRNLGRGARDVAIFEIGSVFRNTTQLPKQRVISTDKRPSADELKEIYGGVPKQPVMVCGLVAGKIQKDGWNSKGANFEWGDAIDLIRNLLGEMVNEYEVLPSDFAPWHPGRCAEFRVDGKAVAHAGELHPRVVANLNLPERSCAFGILLSEVPYSESHKALAVSPMTPVIQDLAIVVDHATSNQSVLDVIRHAGGPLLERVELFDRYDKIESEKVSLAYTLTFRSPERTLTSEEVAQVREQIVATLKTELGGELRA